MAAFLHPEPNRVAPRTPEAPDAGSHDWCDGVRLEALANLAHELRTPVQILLGYLEILREDELDADTEHSIIERMHANAIDLVRMVENVMEFALADAAAKPQRVEEVSLRQIAEDISPVLEAANQRKKLTLKVDVEDPAAMIRVDRRAVRAILENLGVNAIKFTDQGSVRIALRRWNLPVTGPNLVIEVSDSGPGIEDALLERAFEPCVQLSHASTRHFRGMGLGLAVVKRNVELLDAELEVTKSSGGGSTFAVRVPLRPRPAEHCPGAVLRR